MTAVVTSVVMVAAATARAGSRAAAAMARTAVAVGMVLTLAAAICGRAHEARGGQHVHDGARAGVRGAAVPPLEPKPRPI
jgi:hypothetical protein